MGRAGRRWTCPVRRPADRSRSSLRLHGAAEVVLVGGGALGGAVVGVPAGDLPVAVFFGVAALFGGGAGFEFGEGALGAGDGVGGLVGGGYAGPVVVGSRFALGSRVRPGRGCRPRRSRRRRVDGSVSAARWSASRAAARSVRSCSSVISRCWSSTAWSARWASSQCFGAGVALVVVDLDAAGGEFDAGALFGGAGGRGVGVPAGADVVGLLQLRGLPVEHVGQRGGFDGFAAQLLAAGLVGFVVGFGCAQLRGGRGGVGRLAGCRTGRGRRSRVPRLVRVGRRGPARGAVRRSFRLRRGIRRRGRARSTRPARTRRPRPGRVSAAAAGPRLGRRGRSVPGARPPRRPAAPSSSRVSSSAAGTGPSASIAH